MRIAPSDIIATMGIAIRWEDENGKLFAELLDPGFLVEEFLPFYDDKDFPCLRFVDPHGYTIFNQFQITELVRELEKLSAKERDPKVQTHVRAVLEFVRQAAGKAHTYIKFYGD